MPHALPESRFAFFIMIWIRLRPAGPSRCSLHSGCLGHLRRPCAPESDLEARTQRQRHSGIAQLQKLPTEREEAEEHVTAEYVKPHGKSGAGRYSQYEHEEAWYRHMKKLHISG